MSAAKFKTGQGTKRRYICELVDRLASAHQPSRDLDYEIHAFLKGYAHPDAMEKFIGVRARFHDPHNGGRQIFLRLDQLPFYTSSVDDVEKHIVPKQRGWDLHFDRPGGTYLARVSPHAFYYAGATSALALAHAALKVRAGA